ncbi:MAG: alpha/beta hydrolase, partial [Bdellovibrionota bacterium]
YYEIHGAGTPLVLIHGGGSSIDVTFGRGIPILAKNHQVIAFDEQAHGRTEDIDRPYSFNQTADDIAKALEQLQIPQADVIGFSNGGNIAMQLAIRHPERVRKLIVASAFFKRSGIPKQFWDGMKLSTLADMPQELKDAFLKINPDQKKLQRMFDRDSSRMNGFKDWPVSSLKSIKAKTLVMAGDQDVPTLEHVVEMTRAIPGARLFVLPGGHDIYLGNVTSVKSDSRLNEAAIAVIEEFLQ